MKAVQTYLMVAAAVVVTLLAITLWPMARDVIKGCDRDRYNSERSRGWSPSGSGSGNPLTMSQVDRENAAACR